MRPNEMHGKGLGFRVTFPSCAITTRLSLVHITPKSCAHFSSTRDSNAGFTRQPLRPFYLTPSCCLGGGGCEREVAMGMSMAFDHGLRLYLPCHAFTGLIDGRKCGAVREVFSCYRCPLQSPLFPQFFRKYSRTIGVHRSEG